MGEVFKEKRGEERRKFYQIAGRHAIGLAESAKARKNLRGIDLINQIAGSIRVCWRIRNRSCNGNAADTRVGHLTSLIT